MQLSTKSSLSRFQRPIQWQFQTTLVICLLISTPLLAILTWQAQHTCPPMFEPLGGPKVDCVGSSKSIWEIGKFLINHADAAGGFAGIIMALIIAFMGAPIGIVAGAGAIAWLAIRTAISNPPFNNQIQQVLKHLF